MNINITDIHSAALASSRYEAFGARFDDKEAMGTLVVTFTSGGTYAYHNVTVATMRLVLAADSLGSAIAKIVRPAHSFTKLADATPKVEVVAPTDSAVVL